MRKFSAATLALALFGATLSAHAEFATWTDINGQAMRAEFLGRKGDYVSFRRESGAKYLYPYAKLSAADRERVDALSHVGRIETVRPPAPAAPAAPAASLVSPAPAARSAARPGRFTSAVADSLVTVRGGAFAPLPREQILGAKKIALYYSAHWCQPCREFTPSLVQAYTEIKARHPDFELVFVSNDQSAEAMQRYMLDYGMLFPAVRFEHRSLDALRRPKRERGVPNLVLMDANGRDIFTSFTSDGDYRGPDTVLQEIRTHFQL